MAGRGLAIKFLSVGPFNRTASRVVYNTPHYPSSPLSPEALNSLKPAGRYHRNDLVQTTRIRLIGNPLGGRKILDLCDE